MSGDESGKESLLFVDDEPNILSALRRLLRPAGYKIYTAESAGKGLEIMAQANIDLVVSDVDMPRMNGFDLTAKVRADKNLANLPLVLVTALESREDRERGIEVGADAYLVKSSFDQSNLLEIIGRLI